MLIKTSYVIGLINGALASRNVLVRGGGDGGHCSRRVGGFLVAPAGCHLAGLLSLRPQGSDRGCQILRR